MKSIVLLVNWIIRLKMSIECAHSRSPWKFLNWQHLTIVATWPEPFDREFCHFLATQQCWAGNCYRTNSHCWEKICIFCSWVISVRIAQVTMRSSIVQSAKPTEQSWWESAKCLIYTRIQSSALNNYHLSGLQFALEIHALTHQMHTKNYRTYSYKKQQHHAMWFSGWHVLPFCTLAISPSTASECWVFFIFRFFSASTMHDSLRPFCTMLRAAVRGARSRSDVRKPVSRCLITGSETMNKKKSWIHSQLTYSSDMSARDERTYLFNFFT